MSNVYTSLDALAAEISRDVVGYVRVYVDFADGSNGYEIAQQTKQEEVIRIDHLGK